MYGHYPIYTFVLTATATAMAGIALYVWQRRPAPGAGVFTLLLVAVVEWSLSNALEMASTTLDGKVFWGNMQFIGITIVPAAWIVFVLQYTDRDHWLPSRLQWLLAVEPAITLVLAWTNQHHGLLRSRVWLEDLGAVSVLVVDFGIWFWMHAAYSYLLLLAGAVLIIPATLRSPFLYRGQFRAVLVGALMPWIANMLYLFDLGPLPHLDLTPPAFILMAIAITWGLFRFKLLDVVPEARSNVVDRIEDGVVVLGSQDRVLDVNPAAQHIVGKPLHELIGAPVAEAVASIPTLSERLASPADFNGEDFTIEVDGQARVFELHDTPLYHRGKRKAGRLLILRDLTERKRSEDDLVRTQRLAAAGELSLGMSHNLNNILTGVLAPAHMLQSRPGQDAKMKEYLDTIVTSAERATSLVNRLSQITRHDASDLEPVSVGETVGEVIAGSRPRWKDEPESRGVAIEIVADLVDVPAVVGNRSELYDALLNLIFNAIDAMPHGGTIRIATAIEDEAVLVKVGDDGVGMNEATRKRLFEPFFTTKADMGTGLGLSTTYASVRRWGGEIEVESSEGVGTTFLLRLPAWTGPMPEPSEQPGATVDSGAEIELEKARILVAEDESVISMMMFAQLSDAGHEVECVADGEEALASFQPGRFHLAFLDLGIPKIPGDLLSRRLQELDPHLVTILVTGWKLETNDPRRCNVDLYLQKPYVPATVTAMVAEALALYGKRTAADKKTE